jgi:prolyl oligopeptidase
MTRSDTTQGPKFVYLYFYGAIGVATFPKWNTTFQMILELGGAVAIASIHGGGELGFEWQSPAVRLRRRETLEDITLAARWLKKRYGHVVVAGRSYGGLHALAAMVRSQADVDLFVAQMPVSDIPEFLDNGLFGRSAWDDFGFPHNASGDLGPTGDRIEILKGWSPRQHIAELPSPIKPVLLVTGGLDERVEPTTQVCDMALALQAQCGVNAPVHLHVQEGSGHEAAVDGADLTFIAKVLGLQAPKPIFVARK